MIVWHWSEILDASIIAVGACLLLAMIIENWRNKPH